MTGLTEAQLRKENRYLRKLGACNSFYMVIKVNLKHFKFICSKYPAQRCIRLFAKVSLARTRYCRYLRRFDTSTGKCIETLPRRFENCLWKDRRHWGRVRWCWLWGWTCPLRRHGGQWWTPTILLESNSPAKLPRGVGKVSTLWSLFDCCSHNKGLSYWVNLLSIRGTLVDY